MYRGCPTTGRNRDQDFRWALPTDPDATLNAIDLANARQAYVAFHAGTTESRSDLNGFKEAVTIIGDHAVHIAHINSYCRGLTKDP